MADLGTATAPPAPDDDGPAEEQVGPRVVRRRTLPGGRAVVGALLITLAVIGVFAAWLSATATPTTTYAVLGADLAPGDVVTADDLRLVALDLPDEQAARAVADVGTAVGGVALAPLSTGDLLVRSMLRPPAEVPGTSRFSFELPAARALAGTLVPGDRVDVLATDDGVTGFVARDVVVVGIQLDGLAAVLTLAVDDPDLVLALAHAVDEASVHVARSNPDRPADDAVRTDSFDPAATEPVPDDDGAGSDSTSGPTPGPTPRPGGED